MITKKLAGFTALVIYSLLFFSCEHLQITPKNFRGGNCDPDTIYFVNDVLPILVSECASPGCHDSKSAKHGVITDNYDNIMHTAGVTPGNGLKSELVKIMRQKSEPMPPKGKLDDASIAKIRKWIDQGAKNNRCIAGCDSTSFTYSKDISPIINKNCIGCHSTSSNTVLLNSYAEVKLKADDGRLWGSINHLFGYKSMPSNDIKISECDMRKIQKWMAVGAPDN